MIARRDVLGTAAAAPLGATLASLVPQPAEAAGKAKAAPGTGKWATDGEGKRRADLGNGWFRNPILSGDYPDPSILKDGDDYYMTHSSFDGAPGLIIWHSRDLVNWTPLGPALARPLGTVFAVDIAKHDGRYFIYIPFMKASWSTGLADFANIYVIHADSMAGPWSEPIDLKIGGLIDPGHVVGEDGHRYLFLSGVNRVRLTADGLATAGPLEQVYDGWRYPDAWVTEAYSLEGPKLTRRGEWFYLVSAVGGTGGPPTGHMVIVARSRSINGPWVNCPHNPIVRTRTAAEAWWSRGHGTLIEGPRGQWYLVYHGYENGFRTLGRQTLLEPVAWDAAGWPVGLGGDLAKALPMPTGKAGGPHGIARSDAFAVPAFGTRWTFFNPGPREQDRARIGGGALVLAGKGTGPADCSPLTQMAGDHSYEITVALELEGQAEGGLLLFYDERLFLGLGVDGTKMTTWRGGRPSYWREPAPAARSIHLRIVNDRNIVTFYYSLDGRVWTRHAVRSEVSGYNANTVDNLASLRPALYAAGKGSVRFRGFTYRAFDRG